MMLCESTHKNARRVHKTVLSQGDSRSPPLTSCPYLCCNLQVRELSELSQVNERCLELQRNKSAKSSSNKRTSLQKDHGVCSDTTGGVVALSGAARPKQRQQRSSRKAAGCPFLHVQGAPAAFDDFQELVLGTPMDVEELAAVGRNMKVHHPASHCCTIVLCAACCACVYASMRSLVKSKHMCAHTSPVVFLGEY